MKSTQNYFSLPLETRASHLPEHFHDGAFHCCVVFKSGNVFANEKTKLRWQKKKYFFDDFRVPMALMYIFLRAYSTLLVLRVWLSKNQPHCNLGKKILKIGSGHYGT